MLKRGPTEAVNGATQMPFALQVLVDHYKRKPPSSTSMVMVLSVISYFPSFPFSLFSLSLYSLFLLSWHLLVKPAPSPRCTTT